MLYNFYPLLLVTLSSVRMGISYKLYMLSYRVLAQGSMQGKKKKMPCVCNYPGFIQNKIVMGGRSPVVEISNVEYLQAKRWLLYNFNKSSPFSDILV